MERAIGEVFSFNGVKYKVVKDRIIKKMRLNCLKCVFNTEKCLSFKRKRNFGECTAAKRNDNTNVHFVKVW